MELPADIDLSESRLADRRRALGLEDADRERLHAHLAAAEAEWPSFLERLYARLRAYPATEALLRRPGTVERLTRAQGRYLRLLFSAPLDGEHARDLVRIGLVHHRLGLVPQWYVATYAHFICDHLQAFARDGRDNDPALTAALVRSVFYDIGLVLDAYGAGESIVRRARLAEVVGAAAPVAAGHVAQTSAAAAPPGAAPPLTRVHLTPGEVEQRAAFLGLGAPELAALGRLEQAIRQRTPQVLDDFYAFFTDHPETSALVQGPTVGRLKGVVASYWLELSHCDLSRTYAASRMRVGLVHERIGLSLQWYLGGVARQLLAFLDDPALRTDLAGMLAMVRVVFFDLTFVIDAYMEARVEVLMRTDGFASELLASAATAVAIVNPAHRILSANRAMLELFPGDPGLLYRMRAGDAIPMPELKSVLDRVGQGEAPRSVTFGRFAGRQMKVTAYRLAQRPDLPEGAIALLLDDFTGLLRAADEADLDGRRLLEVLDSSGAVLWEMDPASLTVLAVSSAVFALNGFRDVWFVGRTEAWLERAVARDRERLRNFLRGLGAGERRSIDYRIEHPDGAEHWVRSHVTWHRAPGQDAATLRAVTVDIDAERRAQQHRLQSASVLAGGVANVINNSLMAIGGSLEMLARGSPGIDADRMALVQEALGEIATAKGLTSKVLAFAGRQSMQPAVLSLDALVRQSLAADLSSAERLEIDTSPGVWPVSVDPVRLSTALWCLVANAREAMPNGGTIRVRVRNRSGAELEPTDVGVGSDWVEIEVIDQGRGMSADVRRRAIEPFFTTKSADDGHHGLGLSMAFGFAVQSGGYLVIDAAEGSGCTVRLRLPRHVPVSQVAPQPLPDRACVLLVEDHALVRRVVAALLRDFGHDVLPVGSAAEALETLERNSCDLLLSDVRLGRGLDGVDLAAQVRQRLPRIAVILMSGYSAELLDLSRLPAEYRFLGKPFTPEQLQHEVTVALEERKRHATAAAGAP